MNESDHYGPDADPELTAPDDEDEEAAALHQQELETRQWQDQLSQDLGYFFWLAQMAQLTLEQENTLEIPGQSLR